VAAPELSEVSVVTTGRAGRRRDRCGISAASLQAYGALWGCTLASAGAVALLGRPLSSATRRVLGLTLRASENPPPHLSQVLELAGHNIPIAAWPLLLGVVSASRQRLAVRTADILVGASMFANTVPVGAALGAYGGAAIAYLPQLPLEWAGLALGYGSWLVQRRRPMDSRERLARLALIAATLVIAATLETAAVPHG
jgi:hypothetical protein